MNKWITLAAAASIAGCSSTPAPRTAQDTVAATPSYCVASGSAISRPGACNGPGHTYSSTELANTGRTTVAGALGDLDPTGNIHR